MLNQTTRKVALMAIIGMLLMVFTPFANAERISQEVEIRGAVVDGAGIFTYDYTNFAGFWFDMDLNRSSEVMTINVTGRDIAEGDLVYTCSPVNVTYENPALNDTYGEYDIIGFMANDYICYDGNPNELVKLLIEWGSGDKITLSLSDPMELPGGYALVAEDIDLNGDKVWLNLYKDGKRIDNSLEVISGGGTYVYEVDDVLLFSAKIDSVFRGTESNMVVVKYIFMRSDEILDIDGGDNFGVMEVTSTSSGGIVLKNDETMTLDRDSEVDVMGDLYFKVADSTTQRYYLAKTISLECDPCPEYELSEPCPEQTPCQPCPEVVPTEVATDNVTATEPEKKDKDDDEDGSTLPGFEAVFALAGLLAVAAMVMRQRE